MPRPRTDNALQRTESQPTFFDGLDVPHHLNGGALCAQSDPEAFFPRKGAKPTVAKEICGRCPVQVQCLEWAMDQEGSLSGIWGGTTNNERMNMRRAEAA